MIKARLIFIPYINEISKIETEWVKFDSSMSFDQIKNFFEIVYRCLFHNEIVKLGLNQNTEESIISQIQNGDGEVKIEFEKIDMTI